MPKYNKFKNDILILIPHLPGANKQSWGVSMVLFTEENPSSNPSYLTLIFVPDWPIRIHIQRILVTYYAYWYVFFRVIMIVAIRGAIVSHRPTLERKCHHFDEIFVTGCTESCHFDNFRCSQWWKFHQNDDIFVSVALTLYVLSWFYWSLGDVA